MPYATIADLPESVRSALPEAAQRVFLRVFNGVVARDGEERAFEQAWGALKNQGWRRGADGVWVKKAQTAQSVVFRTDESPPEVNGGKGWTAAAAKAWLGDHGFAAPSPDRPESGTQLRYRQFDPDRCNGRFQTLTKNLPAGISIIACAVQRAFKAHLDIRKFDEGQGLAFGWASVAEDAEGLVVDHEGDVIYPEDLEKGVYEFVRDVRKASDSHDPDTIGTGVMIESFVSTRDKQELLGISMPVGWWVGFDISGNPELCKSVRESGGHAMFSVGGVSLEAEDL